MRRTLAIAVALGLATPALAATVAAIPISRMDLPFWHDRFEAKQALIDAGRFDLIYYGDSITQNFDKAGTAPGSDWPVVWQRFYADRHAINLGFKGDTTASLLWRIENGEGDIRGLEGAPRVAIVLIGANNLGRVHWSAPQTLAGIAADVAAIHHHLPQTHVLLLSVLPSDRSDWVTSITKKINAGLADSYGAGQDPNLTFVDVSHVLMKDGHTDDSLFVDPRLRPPDPPLHPDQRGQTLVAEAIEPTLAGLLHDRRH